MNVSIMETLKKYLEYKEKLRNYCSNKTGFFWAFSEQDLIEGQKKIHELGWFNKGEKLCRIQGGGFATKRAIDKFKEFSDEISNKIKNECNPQEIYECEYNNYESDYAADGDLNALLIVADYFGKEKLSEIKRGYASYYSIEDIISSKK